MWSKRKILASIINRIQARVNHEISPTKAAYWMQRSTTEHIFTCKLVKVRTHSAWKKELVHQLYCLTWAQFLTAHLIKDLQHSVEAGKIHIIYQLFNEALPGKCWEDSSNTFKTTTLTPHGDCVNANQFLYCLSKKLPSLVKNYEKYKYILYKSLVETIPTLFGWLTHRQQTLQVLMQQGLFILILSYHFKQIFVHYLKVHCQVWDNCWKVKAL